MNRLNAEFIENKFPFIATLIKENQIGVGVYRAPDLKLLDTNETYREILNGSDYADINFEYELRDNYYSVSMKDMLQNVMGSKKSVYIEECKFKCNNSDFRYINKSVTPIIENEEVTFLVSIFSDVTQKVKVKRDIINQMKIIEKKKQEYEYILDNINTAIVMYKNGEYYIENETARKYIGVKFFNNNEKDCEKLKYYDGNGSEISPDNEPLLRVKRGEVICNEKISTEINGQIKYFVLNGRQFNDKNESIKYSMASVWEVSSFAKETIKNIKDRTSQGRLLETQKKEKEALESIIKMKDEFLYNISHEFKTPLNVIISAIQVLEVIYQDEISERAMLFIKKIKQNTVRQIRMVNNLLDITKIENGYMKFNKIKIDIVFLTKYIVEAINSYTMQKGNSVIFKSIPKNKVIEIDQEKYERILLNLISNGFKFTPKDKKIFIRIFEENNKVCIEVKDEGVGIPKDKQNLVFERFGQVDKSLTRMAEGTGVGLYIVKIFVEGMGGEITLKSSEGSGCIFTIKFPIIQNKEEKIEDVFKNINNNRLIETISIEFSDIYF